MARPFKINDLQLILLASAAQRTDGSLFPPPETVEDQGARIRKAISPLLRNQLVDEVPVTLEAQLWRRDGGTMFGLVINDAGRTRIMVEASPTTEEAPDAAVEVPPEVTAPDETAAPRAGTKTTIVIDLLTRDGGATFDELVAATGWLSHSTRAALTGLRKKGQDVTRFKRGEITCYAIATAS